MAGRGQAHAETRRATREVKHGESKRATRSGGLVGRAAEQLEADSSSPASGRQPWGPWGQSRLPVETASPARTLSKESGAVRCGADLSSRYGNVGGLGR